MQSTLTQTQIQNEIDRLNAYRTELRKVMIGIRNPAQQSYIDRHNEIDRVTVRLGLLYERLDETETVVCECCNRTIPAGDSGTLRGKTFCNSPCYL